MDSDGTIMLDGTQLVKILGLPVYFDRDIPPQVDMYLKDEAFWVRPGRHQIAKFHTLLNKMKEVVPLSTRQEEGNLVEPEFDGTPLQEQLEEAERSIALLTVAVSRAVDVVEALVAERQEKANDVYQAQVDAQDWQNRYNGCQREINSLRDERDTWKLTANHTTRPVDVEHIRELTNEVHSLQDRIEVLTRENTDLELRYEMQSNRAERLYQRTRLLADRLRHVGSYVSVPRERFAGWVTAGRYDEI